jgi:hypothetical protein
MDTQDQIKIQVIFTAQTDHGEFRDALYFDPAVWANLDPAVLEQMKQDRIDNWIYQLENPPEPIEPTEEQLAQQQVDIDSQIQQLQDQKEQISSQISVMQSLKIKQ